MYIKGKAFAKINYSLKVVKKIALMHELDMLVSNIDIANILEIKDNKLNVDRVFFNNIEVFNTNIERGIKFLRRYREDIPYLDVFVDEHIPQQAGLGSSSADVAFLFNVLSRRFNINREILLKDSVVIGSDVPCMMLGGLSRVEGIGDIVTKISNFREENIAVIVNGRKFSTGEIFAAYDKIGHSRVITDKIVDLYQKGLDIKKYMYNDLLQAALIYDKEYIKDLELVESITSNVYMTGSGSALYTYYNSDEEFEELKKNFKTVIKARTIDHSYEIIEEK